MSCLTRFPWEFRVLEEKSLAFLGWLGTGISGWKSHDLCLCLSKGAMGNFGKVQWKATMCVFGGSDVRSPGMMICFCCRFFINTRNTISFNWHIMVLTLAVVWPFTRMVHVYFLAFLKHDSLDFPWLSDKSRGPVRFFLGLTGVLDFKPGEVEKLKKWPKNGVICCIFMGIQGHPPAGNKALVRDHGG